MKQSAFPKWECCEDNWCRLYISKKVNIMKNMYVYVHACVWIRLFNREIYEIWHPNEIQYIHLCWILYLKKIKTDWGNGSVGKVLVTQAWRPEFEPPAPMKNILHSSAGLYCPKLRRERQEDPWACCPVSLALSVRWEMSLKIKMERNQIAPSP